MSCVGYRASSATAASEVSSHMKFIALMTVLAALTLPAAADTIAGSITIHGKSAGIPNETIDFSFVAEPSVQAFQVGLTNLTVSSIGPLSFVAAGSPSTLTEFLDFVDSEGDDAELHTDPLSLINFATGNGPLQFRGAPLFMCPGTVCQSDYGLFPPQVFDDAGSGVGITSFVVTDTPDVTVPEPSTFVLIFIGIVALATAMRLGSVVNGRQAWRLMARPEMFRKLPSLVGSMKIAARERGR